MSVTLDNTNKPSSHIRLTSHAGGFGARAITWGTRLCSGFSYWQARLGNDQRVCVPRVCKCIELSLLHWRCSLA